MANILNGLIPEPSEIHGSLVGTRGPEGPQGPPGPEGPQGPEGPAGTTEWSGLDNKPFETIGEGLGVDDGVLNSYAVWEDVTNKPFNSVGNGLSVDSEGVLNTDPIDYSEIQNTPTIPENTSDLNNDSGFITSADIPTELSDFNNDVGFITGVDSSDITTALGYTPYDDSNPDGFITSADIPTDISDFNNDAGYITSADIPTNVSDFNNDAGYITSADIPDDLSDFNNDVGYITGIDSSDVTSALGYTPYDSSNPDGFITSSDIPDWDTLDNKPFDSIGNGLSVDSEGVLSAVGSGVSDWNDISNKPFETLGSSLSVDSSGELNIEPIDYSDIQNTPDLSNYMVKGVDYVTAGQLSGSTLGTKSTAEGIDTTASGNYSHAEGVETVASGNYSHAEGRYSAAGGRSSHAEGEYTITAEFCSHAEGYDTEATQPCAHAEGAHTIANGVQSHAEGFNTTASAYNAHAEGDSTKASGQNAHAEGFKTTASRRSQHVFGEFNITDTTGQGGGYRGTYIEIVGNGTNEGLEYVYSNARTLDWDGNEVLAGKLTVGAAPTNNMDVATKQYVDTNIPTVPTNVSDFVNDAGYITSADIPDWGSLDNKPFETVGNGLSVDSAGNLNVDPIDYSDIQNTPTIPDSTSDLVNDSGFITNTVNDLTNYTLSSSLATVATSGSYSDLSNKPTIPDSTSDLVNDSGFITSSDIPDWSSLDNKPFETLGNTLEVDSAGELNVVETVPDWSDVTNKPFDTIGSGLSVDSAGELSAPTNVSDLTNDVGYITAGIFSYDSQTGVLSITTV